MQGYFYFLPKCMQCMVALIFKGVVALVFKVVVAVIFKV